MNIIFIIDTMLAGGAQKVLLSHANYLTKVGHNVTIVSLKKANKYNISKDINFIELIELDETITSNIFYILQELAIIVKLSDIIIGFSSFIVNYISFTLSKLYEVPLLICLRNLLSGHIKDYPTMIDINSDILKSILKNSSIMVQSDVIKQDIIENFNVNDKNISILANPIDSKISKAQLNSTKSIDFIVVGRLEKQKNPKLILKAFAKIKAKIEKNISIHFIGEGKLQENLKQLSAELDIEKNIIFHGHKNNTLELINSAKYLILASTHEGLSNVILEAFSQKTPVLASDIKPTQVLVKDKKTGILFKNNDSDDLADKMLYCLNNDLHQYSDKAYKSLHKYQNIHNKFELLLKDTIKQQAKRK